MSRCLTLFFLVVIGFGCRAGTPPASAEASAPNHVMVHPTAPPVEGFTEPETDLAPIVRTPEEWRAMLSAEAFRVLREEGTERPFTSPLDKETRAGVYACAGCGLPLFHSEQKYDSRTGWPSFWAPLHPQHLGDKVDRSLFMRRVEVHCIRCGGHLGHVFTDGPQPTGLRYCLNGVALKFIPSES